MLFQTCLYILKLNRAIQTAWLSTAHLHLHFQIRGEKGMCPHEKCLKHVAKVKRAVVRGMLQFTMNWNVTKGSMWQPSIFSGGFCFYTLWDTLSEKHLCLCISAEEWAPEGVGNLQQWLCIHSSRRWGICLYTLQARLPPHLWHIPIRSLLWPGSIFSWCRAVISPLDLLVTPFSTSL